MNLHTRLPRELFRRPMHNFHSFSHPTKPVIPFPLTADRWKNFPRTLCPKILWIKKKKREKEKGKKKTLKNITRYSTDDSKDRIRRDKDLPRGKQKGERSDMYDGSWMLHDCLDHSSTQYRRSRYSRLLAYRKYCSRAGLLSPFSLE